MTSHYLKTPTSMRPAEMVGLGQTFKQLTGKQPARDDFKGAARKKWEEQLGIKLPIENQIIRTFGEWGAYLSACGFEPSTASRIQNVERIAVDHCKQELGFTEEDYERSITDGWLPNGETAEVKGATLIKHKIHGTHSFNWRIHGRDLSKSADWLILVGIGMDGTPLIRLEIPREALPHIADGRSNVTLYTSSVWGGGNSKLRRFVKYVARMPEKDLIEKHAQQERETQVEEAKEKGDQATHAEVSGFPHQGDGSGRDALPSGVP